MPFFCSCLLWFIIYSHVATISFLMESLMIFVQFMHNYVDPLFSKYPGPILSSWDDLSSYLVPLRRNINDATRLNSLQKEVLEWYELFKNTVKSKLAASLDASMTHRMSQSKPYES